VYSGSQKLSTTGSVWMLAISEDKGDRYTNAIVLSRAGRITFVSWAAEDGRKAMEIVFSNG
jgi:hypothetical protein